MVEVDFLKHTYTCPFCGREQVYWSSHSSEDVGFTVLGAMIMFRLSHEMRSLNFTVLNAIIMLAKK